MLRMDKTRWYYLYILLLIALYIILFPDFWKHGLLPSKPDPRDERIRTELIHEYEQLQPLPGATLVHSDRIIRNGSGVIGYGFSTELDDAVVLAYYDKQLKDSGWTFQKDEAVKYMGFNTHERVAIYTKNEYVANVGYNYEENERGEIRFTLSLEKPVQ